MTTLRLLLLVVATFCVASFSFAKPTVVATNYPMKYFAERIGGDAVTVVYPVPDGIDPAFWKPAVEDLVKMQQADLILMNGATYEKWAGRVSLPPRNVVRTADAFKDKFIEIESGVTHSHGPAGEHAHTGTAFTTWLDFDQALKQATVLRDAFIGKMPAARATIETNYAALAQDLKQLDADMKEVAKAFAKQPMVASHPIYQYWARRYNLKIHAMMWEPDVEPSGAEWTELAKLARDKQPAKFMVWEGTPLPISLKKVEALGLVNIVFEPCGNNPSGLLDGKDFIEAMRANIASMKDAAKAIQMPPSA